MKRIFMIVTILLFTPLAYADCNTQAIQHKKITIEQHPIFYNEIGKGPVVILVHGLFANKEQWSCMLPLLAQSGYRVIAPDLPGYGKSLGFPKQDYYLKNQVVLLHQFVNQLKINKFNIAGNSMGGGISALYTRKYPAEIYSLAFIGAPLGIRTPHSSETDLLFKKGEDPFIPVTTKAFHRLVNILFMHPPRLTQKEINQYIQKNIQNKNLKEYIVNDAVSPYIAVLEKKMTIHQPILIIWGAKDRVFDISGAKKLQNNLDPSRLVILKNMGHLPQVECYKTVTKVYSLFLRNDMKSKIKRSVTKKLTCDRK